jgi:putative transposase
MAAANGFCQGPTGPLPLTVPRAVVFRASGQAEWQSRVLPRYQRRLPELDAAIVTAYLSGANSRRVSNALRPLLGNAPLSKSAVSRLVGKLKVNFEQWQSRRLGSLQMPYLYLDAIALPVRRAGKVVSTPVLVAVGVLANGQKQLLALEVCGSESVEAWKGFIDNLVQRGLKPPLLCVVDGNPGLRSAIELAWPKALVQRCVVHKLRNLKRKAPLHAHAELAADFHRMVYAESEGAARVEKLKFERKWAQRCPAVLRSFAEGGNELLTYFRFPKLQWKTLRTTNAIERLNEEFRRRIKTQASLPNDEAALVLLYSLVATGQIKLRKLDGFAHLPGVISTLIKEAA